MNLNKIFSLKKENNRLIAYFAGIKIAFKITKVSNIGENNIINIDKDIKRNITIKGTNNKIYIKSAEPVNGYNKKFDITKININICGNNNTIIIDGIYNSKLSIDIGNYTGVNNTNIRIGKYFESVDLSILAHQNNLNIEIGENCLFSRNIVIRGGELPHKIYDKETKTNLDNSKGITIGNHVWVGESVFIMKRARISNNTIVGCGAVVTKQFDEENVVLAGNPAKICKTNINWDKN